MVGIRFNIVGNYVRMGQGMKKQVYALRINENGKVTDYSLTEEQVKDLDEDIRNLNL